MYRKILLLVLFACLFLTDVAAQKSIEQNFLNPPASAKPWVFWYWMYGSVSKEGIKADLEAMKQVGIGGAFIMTVRDTSSSIPFQPQVRTLTPEWWKLIAFTMKEAKRLNLQIAMNTSDGFELAGGPWITPDKSMQKLVWSKTYVKGGDTSVMNLAQPDTEIDYYNDIAVYAYPANCSNAFHEVTQVPSVTTSTGVKASFLSFQANSSETFKSDSACWIQYKYPRSFTCRSIKIQSAGNNYQSLRLKVEASEDGEDFKTVAVLEAPRHGWQDTDEDVTYSVPETSARYYRFVYNKEGSEPGAEDLDAAKWKQSLKIKGIYLSDEPMIHQYESKNGSMWRISKNTTQQQVPVQHAVPLNSIINLTGKMDADGNLKWLPPAGNNWVIVRVGHTSNGHTNYTAGAGLGLECDKFDKDIITLQFNNWYAKAFEQTDEATAKEVLKLMHIDSWESGSQNWSSSFANEFKQRRGYDLMPYLLVLTGVPVDNAEASEKILHDVRQTIAELVSDVFYKTLHELAATKGSSFSSESVAPTMMSDGMMYFKHTDYPMGEFWLNSPTHDKPNDMLDAVHAAHIYGKNIVLAESFTTVRMDWTEHPGSLKIIGDRNFALGINKIAFHVFTHNPWMDKKPGMSMNGVGLFFQRDQTWFKQSKVWIDYLTRCQALLQMGKPVADIAVFTGEEVPRRSVLPQRLINTLPGIVGKERVESEKIRLQNSGLPLREIPDGVPNSANMPDAEDWIDPLNGYIYDSFNPDALMMMKVKNGRVVLPGGASYAVLVFPAEDAMNPNNTVMSVAVAKKILELLKAGAKIIMGNEYATGAGFNDSNAEVQKLMKEIVKPGKKGKLFLAPYTDIDFAKIGIEKDVEIISKNKTFPNAFAWTHRKTADADIYFVSNQTNTSQQFEIKFRDGKNKYVQWFDPVTGSSTDMSLGHKGNSFTVGVGPGNSNFYVFRKTKNASNSMQELVNEERKEIDLSAKPWTVQFDKNFGGPVKPVKMDVLKSWTSFPDSSVRFYSGTAVYSNSFEWNGNNTLVNLQMDSVYNIATVKVNGIDCGTFWTYPFSVNIAKALKQGTNTIDIEVTNTWHNRLIGDETLPLHKRITYTNAPFRLKNKPLQPAGLVGEVKLIVQ
ncbi:MAG: glycosyl hydrolase [Lacibacter sp.]